MKSILILFCLLLSSLNVFAQQQRGGGGSVRQSSGTSSKWKFGAGVSYSMNGKVKYDSAVAPPFTGTADFTYESGFSLELEARNLATMSWGFVGVLTADSDRKITEGNLYTSGANFSYITTDPPKFQTTTVLLNAAYRWNQFYIPFGVNYSVFKVTDRSTFVGSSTATGGINGQAGIGFVINDSFVTELTYRLTTVKWTQVSSGVTTTYDKGNLANIFASVRYLF